MRYFLDLRVMFEGEMVRLVAVTMTKAHPWKAQTFQSDEFGYVRPDGGVVLISDSRGIARWAIKGCEALYELARLAAAGRSGSYDTTLAAVEETAARLGLNVEARWIDNPETGYTPGYLPRIDGGAASPMAAIIGRAGL